MGQAVSGESESETDIGTGGLDSQGRQERAVTIFSEA
jgi:hypothetical protein